MASSECVTPAETKISMDRFALWGSRREDIRFSEQEHLVYSLMTASSQIVCLNMEDPNGVYYEPHLTFSPCLAHSKKYTDEEKLARLQSVKIRVTLDALDKTGQVFKRVGPIGNLTLNEIFAFLTSGKLEDRINFFRPGMRFIPEFSKQWSAGLARLQRIS